MPSEIKTPNIGLNNWQGNEYPKRQDFVNDNLILDEKIGLLSDSIIIKHNISILSTNWIDDTANSGFWIYEILDEDITADTMVDVNIHLEYLDIAQGFLIQSANNSSVGKVIIYAKEKPLENIVCDLKIVRQVV